MLEEKTDVLIIGAGAAGIRAAIEVSKQKTDVILTTKGPLCRDGAATWLEMLSKLPSILRIVLKPMLKTRSLGENI